MADSFEVEKIFPPHCELEFVRRRNSNVVQTVYRQNICYRYIQRYLLIFLDEQDTKLSLVCLLFIILSCLILPFFSRSAY